MRNHGLLTVGHSVEETVFWYVTMERTCEVELLARAAGEVVPMSADAATAAAGIHRRPAAAGIRRRAAARGGPGACCAGRAIRR